MAGHQHDRGCHQVRGTLDTLAGSVETGHRGPGRLLEDPGQPGSGSRSRHPTTGPRTGPRSASRHLAVPGRENRRSTRCIRKGHPDSTNNWSSPTRRRPGVHPWLGHGACRTFRFRRGIVPGRRGPETGSSPGRFGSPVVGLVSGPARTETTHRITPDGLSPGTGPTQDTLPGRSHHRRSHLVAGVARTAAPTRQPGTHPLDEDPRQSPTSRIRSTTCWREPRGRTCRFGSGRFEPRTETGNSHSRHQGSRGTTSQTAQPVDTRSSQPGAQPGPLEFETAATELFTGGCAPGNGPDQGPRGDWRDTKHHRRHPTGHGKTTPGPFTGGTGPTR